MPAKKTRKPKVPARNYQVKKMCTYGTARTKLLDMVEKVGPCTKAELVQHLRYVMRPSTVSATLVQCNKEGSLVMPVWGVYTTQRHLAGLSRLQVMQLVDPSRLSVLVAFARKGRPVLPDVMANELAAQSGVTFSLKTSTYLRIIRELRQDGSLRRVPGRGAELLVNPDLNEALHQEGFMPKKHRGPRAVSPQEAELQQLLS